MTTKIICDKCGNEIKTEIKESSEYVELYKKWLANQKKLKDLGDKQ